MNRIERLQSKIAAQQLAALFITHPTNIYYLTGIRGMSQTEREFTMIVRANEAIVLVPQMYESEAAATTNGLARIEIVPERHYLFTEAAKRMTAGEKIGFEAENLRYAEYEKLKISGADLSASYGIVEQLRICKDAAELELVRKAVEITDQTVEYVIQNVKIGMTEKEVAKMIAAKMEELGAEKMSFDPIVASGAGSALPHYHTSDKQIGEGMLLIDLGAVYKGYAGDLTRVIYIGTPDQKFIDTYNKVDAALMAAINGYKPGMECEQVWQLAVDSLGDESKYFIHGLGHGIGLDTHEDPYLRKDIHNVIEPGTLITVEPGLYYPDWGGIRLEEYCLFTETDVEILSKADRKLTTISGK